MERALPRITAAQAAGFVVERIVLYDADELPPEAFLPPINLKKRAQKPDDTSMVVGCAILGLLAFLLLLWIKAC